MSDRQLRNLPRRNYRDMSKGTTEKGPKTLIEALTETTDGAMDGEKGDDISASASLGASGDLVDIGDSPHSSDEETPDNELVKMKTEMEALQKEEKRLRKVTELEEMRRKLDQQRQKVQNLRGYSKALHGVGSLQSVGTEGTRSPWKVQEYSKAKHGVSPPQSVGTVGARSLFSSQDYRRVVIISDSIAKNVTGIFGTKVLFFRGNTISQVAARLDQCLINFEPYDYVMFHLGTNDIDNRASFDNIISDFGNLIGICRNKKRAIQIIISSILPRPADHDVSDPMIRDVNKYLKESMSKSVKFKFVCSYKPFMQGGNVRRELFAKNDGGFHLNTAGTDVLKRFFIREISTL